MVKGLLNMLNRINRFKANIGKVLPSVYNDSLSYSEAICKLTSKLNEVITRVNNIALGEAPEITEQSIIEAVKNSILSWDEITEITQELENIENNYALKASLNNYYNKTESDERYLTKIVADTIYLSENKARSIFLTTATADLLYERKGAVSGGGLSKEEADIYYAPKSTETIATIANNTANSALSRANDAYNKADEAYNLALNSGGTSGGITKEQADTLYAPKSIETSVSQNSQNIARVETIALEAKEVAYQALNQGGTSVAENRILLWSNPNTPTSPLAELQAFSRGSFITGISAGSAIKGFEVVYANKLSVIPSAETGVITSLMFNTQTFIIPDNYTTTAMTLHLNTVIGGKAYERYIDISFPDNFVTAYAESGITSVWTGSTLSDTQAVQLFNDNYCIPIAIYAII